MIMKLELEKAARQELVLNHPIVVDMGGFKEPLYNHTEMLSMFRKGAEWQAKQSPWISVKDRLPETDDNVLYANFLSGALRVGFYFNNNWYEAYTGDVIYGVTHWMPIPSFDEILEANRDVLERIKQKGD